VVPQLTRFREVDKINAGRQLCSVIVHSRHVHIAISIKNHLNGYRIQ